MDPQNDLPASSTTPPPAPPAAAAGSPAGSARASATWDAGLEKFASAYLNDRRSERRWRVFFRLAWLGVFLVIAWLLFASRNHVSSPNGPHTALVEVRGEISVDSESSAELMVGALKTAFEDPGAKAVVLRINSPGGSPVQSGIIHDEIVRLKALHKKPVYAVVEEVCASGAYYIAVATDEIYTDKASVVGSIGVLMDSFGFTGTMDKLGVERRLITAGENKGFMDPFSPLNPKQKEYAETMLKEIHRQFIDVVKQGRGNRLKESPDMFSGLVWTGQKSIELGLSDALGSVDYVAREVIKAEDIVDFTPRENIAERLARRFGSATAEALLRQSGGSSLR